MRINANRGAISIVDLVRVIPVSSRFQNDMSQDPKNRNLDFSHLPDEKLMLEVQRGTGDAFAALFDRYHRLVLVTALKIMRDVGEAEEVTQNVFFEIFRSADKFDPRRGDLKVWLLQYAYHRSMDRRNYLLIRQSYNRLDLEALPVSEDRNGLSLQLPVQEVKQLIEEALGALNGPQRRTIQKVFFEGLTLKEVAEETNESFSNVRNHYYRGMDRLRACLRPQPLALRHERALPSREVSRVKT